MMLFKTELYDYESYNEIFKIWFKKHGIDKLWFDEENTLS